MIETLPETAERGDRNTIGGWPLLAEDEPWPRCYCGEPMVFFFRVDIPAGIPAFGGDHLLVFQCPVHDEVAVPAGRQLPERYWDTGCTPYDGPFWRILLRGPGVPAVQDDRHMEPYRLVLRQDREAVDGGGRGRHGFKIGGVASWAQFPEELRCACGNDLVLLAQVPENWGFDMWPMKDKDVHGTSDEQAQLFLGNEVYILACPGRCHPEALWPVLQN